MRKTQMCRSDQVLVGRGAWSSHRPGSLDWRDGEHGADGTGDKVGCQVQFQADFIDYQIPLGFAALKTTVPAVLRQCVTQMVKLKDC